MDKATSTTTQELTLQVVNELDQHPAHVHVQSLSSAASRISATWCQEVIAKLASQGRADRMSLDWSSLRYSHTVAIRAQLSTDYRYSASTCNLILSALRGTLKTAWRLNLISSDEYQKAIDLKPIPGYRLPAGRALSREEIKMLLNSCDKRPIGRRDAAIIACLYSGLRRAEVVGLNLSDFNRKDRELRVIGKGNKERIVPIMDGGLEAIESWLKVRGTEPGPLFWILKRNGIPIKRRPTSQNIYSVLNRHRIKAGIEDEIRPHDLRRTLISDLLDQGVDIVAVGGIVGHKNTQTTARYDRRGERAKREGIRRVSLPYEAD